MITKTKYIEVIELPDGGTIPPNPNASRVIIIDRSGSMYGEINHVIDNVINAVNAFPNGDTVTIGWFSSENGMFRFEIIGHVLSENRTPVLRVLDSMRYVKNRTCFSEILSDAQNVITTLRPFGLPISLIFHSDGYPVVSNPSAEEKNIFENIKRIREALSEVIVVGYGEYYNRELLSRMADAMGGQLVHSQNYIDFRRIVNHYIDTSNPTPTCKVAVSGYGVFFDSNGNVYEKDGDSILVPYSTPRLYRYSSVPEEEMLVDESVIYTCARILLTKERVDEALNLLTEIGDVHAAKAVSSSWTPEEFGNAAEFLRLCAEDSSRRYLGGCKPGEKPPLDEPCLLDVIDAMVDDGETRLWMGRGFNYKRIGVPRVPVDSAPKFSYDEDLSVSLDDLVWNSKRLNLSARFSIPGHAEIGPNDLGLPEHYPCVKFRTFSIITDGRLNIEGAAFSMSHATFNVLKGLGVIVGVAEKGDRITPVTDWFKNVPYWVSFKDVPLINGSIAMTVPNTEYICDKLIAELSLEAMLRVMNAKSKILKEAGVVVAEDGLTPEQQAYLESLGIVKGVYRPAMKAVDAADSYIAKTFEIAIKGFSSLPHPDKVYEKKQADKKLTPSEQIVFKALEEFDADQPRVESTEQLLEWIEGEKRDIRKSLTNLRSEVQRAKFAVILGHKWFPGVDRQNPVYLHDGLEFQFKFGQEEIEL